MDQEVEQQLFYKLFVHIVVDQSKELDKFLNAQSEPEDDEEDDDATVVSDMHFSSSTSADASIAAKKRTLRSRIEAVLDGLWTLDATQEMVAWTHDWEGWLDYILLDHSATEVPDKIKFAKGEEGDEELATAMGFLVALLHRIIEEVGLSFAVEQGQKG